FLTEAGSGLATLGIAASPGVPSSVAEQTIVVDYNDVDQAAGAVQRHAEDLAAIFVEPVAGNMGCVPPLPGFLEALRSLCDAAGLSVLRRLRVPALYDELERRASQLESGLAPFGRVQRVGAMLTFFTGSDPVAKFQQLDTARYGELFRGVLDRGIYLAPSQYE